MSTTKSLYALAHDRGQLLTAGVEGAILRWQITPQLEPIDILQYGRSQNYNVFLFAGQPDQSFVLENSRDLRSWAAGPSLEILDASGTLLFAEPLRTNALGREFYRAVVGPAGGAP